MANQRFVEGRVVWSFFQGCDLAKGGKDPNTNCGPFPSSLSPTPSDAIVSTHQVDSRRF